MRHAGQIGSTAKSRGRGAFGQAGVADEIESDLQGASRSMEESMTEAELEEMASTKRKGKPEHKSKN